MAPRALPTSGPAKLAGGRRVKKSKTTGPSKELLKQRKIDDKERKRKADKAARGNLRNDSTMEALYGIGKGTIAVLVVFAVFIQVVKRIKISPSEAADIAVGAVLEFLRVHGIILFISIASLSCVGGVIYFVRRAMLQKRQSEENELEKAKLLEQRAKNRNRKRLAAKSRNQKLNDRMRRQLEQIRAEEAELARIRRQREVESQAEKARIEKINEEAAQWSDSEQEKLNEALEVVTVSEGNTQNRWESVASLVGNRTPEECLARIQYIRKQAQVEMESAFLGGDGLDADFGDDDDIDKDGQVQSGPSYVNWYNRQYGGADYDDYEEEDDSGDDDCNNDNDDTRERVELELEPVRKGTEIELDGIMLWKAGFVRVKTLNLQVVCTRCQSSHDCSLSGDFVDGSSWAKHCMKCAVIMRCSLRPCLVHDQASSLGFVDTTACSVKDVLPSPLYIECIDCQSEHELPSLRRGNRIEATCHTCHHKMAFESKRLSINALSIADANQKNEGSGSSHAKLKGRKEQIVRIIEGQPLPQNGGCDHFKKSLRWLRFPCCGKAFPCPVCHELSGCDGGAMGVLANKMICGKCSHEQNYANTPCISCKFHMGKKSSGAHWSGGTGSRDTSNLSRKDHRKNKGVSKSGALKTKSKKSERVGAAGKAKRSTEN